MVDTNPYTPFNPALDNFVGRKAHVADFEALLPHLAGRRHVLLTGEGGVGKSSLLLKLLDICLRATERRNQKPLASTVYFDVTMHLGNPAGMVNQMVAGIQSTGWLKRVKDNLGLRPTAGTADVSKKVLERLRDGVTLGFPFPGISLGALFQPRQQGAAGLLEAFDYLRERLASNKMPLVVLIDQLERVLDLTDRELFAGALASLLRENIDAPVLFVMALRPEAKGTIEHYLRPDIFDPAVVDHVVLENFSDLEARTAITAPAQAQGVTLSTNTVQLIHSRIGNHPYYLQLASAIIWDHLATSGLLEKKGNVALGAEVVDDLLREQQHRIFAEFAPSEQLILKTMALAAGPLDEIELVEKVKASADIGLGKITAILKTLLTKHKYRPLKYVGTEKAYDVAHDLFRDHIIHHECQEEERELEAVRQELNARTIAWQSGDRLPLSSWALQRILRFGNLIRLDRQQVQWLIESAVRYQKPEWVAHTIEVAQSRLDEQSVRTLVGDIATVVQPASYRQFRALETLLREGFGIESSQYSKLMRESVEEPWFPQAVAGLKLPVEMILQAVEETTDSKALWNVLRASLTDIDTSLKGTILQRLRTVIGEAERSGSLTPGRRRLINKSLAIAGDDSAVAHLLDDFLRRPNFAPTAKALLAIDPHRIISVATDEGRLNELRRVITTSTTNKPAPLSLVEALRRVLSELRAPMPRK